MLCERNVSKYICIAMTCLFVCSQKTRQLHLVYGLSITHSPIRSWVNIYSAYRYEGMWKIIYAPNIWRATTHKNDFIKRSPENNQSFNFFILSFAWLVLELDKNLREQEKFHRKMLAAYSWIWSAYNKYLIWVLHSSS